MCSIKEVSYGFEIRIPRFVDTSLALLGDLNKKGERQIRVDEGMCETFSI